jgi:hypothetical protein
LFLQRLATETAFIADGLIFIVEVEFVSSAFSTAPNTLRRRFLLGGYARSAEGYGAVAICSLSTLQAVETHRVRDGLSRHGLVSHFSP